MALRLLRKGRHAPGSEEPRKKWGRLKWRGSGPRFCAEKHQSKHDEDERVSADFCDYRGDDTGCVDVCGAGRWNYGGDGVRAGESGAAEAAGGGTRCTTGDVDPADDGSAARYAAAADHQAFFGEGRGECARARAIRI